MSWTKNDNNKDLNPAANFKPGAAISDKSPRDQFLSKSDQKPVASQNNQDQQTNQASQQQQTTTTSQQSQAQQPNQHPNYSAQQNPAAQNASAPQTAQTTTDSTVSTPAEPMQTNHVEESKDTTSNKYAGFVRRYGAATVDGFLIGIVNWLLSLLMLLPMTLLGTSEDAGIAAGVLSIAMWLVQMTIWVGYYVYFIGSKAQTPGKMLFKIVIQKEETNDTPSYTTAFLREVIGKFVSFLVLGLGFIWIIFDSKKQGWHDKIAGTVALEDGELGTGRKILLALIMILPLLAILGVLAAIILVGFSPVAQLEEVRQEQMMIEQQQMELEQMQQEFMDETDEPYRIPTISSDEN